MNAHHGLARWIDVHAGVKDEGSEMSAWACKVLLRSSNDLFSVM